MITILSKKDPEWSAEHILIKETTMKYIVWFNERKLVEIHYPKHLYYKKENQ